MYIYTHTYRKFAVPVREWRPSKNITSFHPETSNNNIVVRRLAQNFREQQRDQIHFTKEQVDLRSLIDEIDSWLGEAKVHSLSSEVPPQLQI